MGDIKEDFYLVLSGSVGPNKSEFSTKLTSRINLIPGYGFECALTKIIYPNTLANCYDGQLSYYSFALQKFEHTRIPMGYYTFPDEFIAAWHSALQQDSQYYELSVANPNSKRFSLLLKSDATGKVPVIELSQNLATLSGLPKKIAKDGYEISEQSWDVLGGSSILYVYSSITENVLINSTSAPLLCVAKFDFDKDKPCTEYEPHHRTYVPLERRYFDELTIALRNTKNQPFPFLSGDVVVVVHIRPNSNLIL